MFQGNEAQAEDPKSKHDILGGRHALPLISTTATTPSRISSVIFAAGNRAVAKRRQRSAIKINIDKVSHRKYRLIVEFCLVTRQHG